MTKLQKTVTSFSQTLQQMSNWILEAARRIFSASDDDYPATGPQPFEGDISDARRQH
ncbi:MAG: hypothetical protein AAFY78_11920 [Cyanobacteria bacterium J06648_16]